MRQYQPLMCVLLLAAVLGVGFAAAPLQSAQAQAPGFEVRTIPVDIRGFGMKLSPDGKTLALFANSVIYNDEPTPLLVPIWLFDISTGSEIGSLRGQTDFASDVAFTPDGKRLASLHGNGYIYLWEVPERRLIRRIVGVFGRNRAAFLPDGQTLVVLDNALPANMLLWDTTTGHITGILRVHFGSFQALRESLDAFGHRYSAFALSPDGSLAATATFSDEVSLWEIASGEQVMLRPPSEKKGMISIRAMVFSAGGKQLVYFDGQSKRTHVWDVETRTERQVLSLGSYSFALSPDGEFIAWADNEAKQIRLARLSTPEQVIEVVDIPSGLQITPFTTLAFTPDGTQLVAGGFHASRDSQNLIFVVTLRSESG